MSSSASSVKGSRLTFNLNHAVLGEPSSLAMWAIHRSAVVIP